VTIFDRRSVSPDGTHLYYISFYLESPGFHTKHMLIYSSIREKKIMWEERIIKIERKNNMIGTKYHLMHEVRTER
jgi:hypothetical protein